VYIIDEEGVGITWHISIASLTTPTLKGKGIISVLGDTYSVTLFNAGALEHKNAMVVLEEPGKDPVLTYMFEYVSRRDFSAITLHPYKNGVNSYPTVTYIARIRKF